MKADRPSRTAQFVTLGRALADAGVSHVPDFHDPTARAFLNDKRKQALARIEQAIQTGRRGRRLEMARAMADTMALRTVAIDDAVRDAIRGGATQLVILGAGYDGRAWRMPELAGVKIFEIDHPATQGSKRDHLAELPPAFGTVSFTPIDFEREPLDRALDWAAHDRSAPTCWIWEGVVMYLTHDAMRSTLAAVAERSAPGSTLIVNYHAEHRRFLAKLMFWLIGEPMISAWKPDEMLAVLRTVGFVVHEDSGMHDWNARFAQGGAKVDRWSYMRIAIAHV
jgi:methyltransferase (TIGR00027 family)